MSFDTVVRNGTAVLPGQGVQPLDIGIAGGRIAALLRPGETVADGPGVIDASGLHIFPGLIDAHVHFGFGEPITEYTTETVYAAQGGFTTIIGYFLSSRSYKDIFGPEKAHAEARAHVDFAFHFSTASETHRLEMADYMREFGVTSFKYFMNFKGEEGRYLGLDGTDDGFFYELLEDAARLKQPLIVCHTENIEMVNRIRRRMIGEGRSTLRDWSRSKPAITEAESLVRAMYLAEKTGARIYIPHLSSGLALEEWRHWRSRYERIFIETCPHYLTHTEDAPLEGLGKANPPFRRAEDVAALWEGLADGSIHVVASDHVPRKRATKLKGIWQASQGFPGTATILPVLLGEGYHKGRLGLQRIAELLTSAPAAIFGLAPAKGDIRVGGDADLTLVDLALERRVDWAELGSYSDYSLYEGQTFKGWPVRTIVRGITVMHHHRIVGAGGFGRYLPRS